MVHGKSTRSAVESWQPPYSRWASRGELDQLAQPEQRAVLDAYFAEAERGLIPELRAPWCRSGWLDAAKAWMLAQPLSDLHQAISYQHILVGLEPSAQAELGDSVPYYVRKVLQALRPPRGEHDT